MAANVSHNLTRSHSQHPSRNLLARNNRGSKVEFEPDTVLDAEINASLGRLSPKVENGNEVWAVPTTPSPSNVTVASYSKEDVTPRIVVSVTN